MSLQSLLMGSLEGDLADNLLLKRVCHWVQVVGMALVFVAMADVLFTKQVPWPLWLLPGLHCLVGPHVGWFLFRRFPDSRAVALFHMVVPPLVGGLCIALVDFSLLPMALLLLLMGLRAVSNGDPQLWLRGMLAHLPGFLLGGVLFGWHWQPMPSLVVMLVCLPLLALQPLMVSVVARRIILTLREKQVTLEHLSQHDGLSGLYNRSHWEGLVRAEFARYRRGKVPATLVLADLDHFKRINDENGHAAGDEVIRRFAAALNRVFRETDVCGRYGGEEFGMLLPLTSGTAARDVIERLRRDMRESPLLDGGTVTASFGVAELTDEVTGTEMWLRLADQMLYRAKHLGRDRVMLLGEEVPSVPTPLEAEVVPPPTTFASLLEAGDPQEHAYLLSGLEAAPMPLGLFDPSDRLVLANSAFVELFEVQPGASFFADIMRHCHAVRKGPVVVADNIDDWLRAADIRRRSRRQRTFLIDTNDQRLFYVFETCYADGWLLVTLFDVTDGKNLRLTPMLPQASAASPPAAPHGALASGGGPGDARPPE